MRLGFNPSLKRPACLATLMSCDTTKQFVCGCQYIRSLWELSTLAKELTVVTRAMQSFT